MSRLLPHMKRIWRGMPVSPMVRTILGTPVWYFLTARGRANLRRVSEPATIPPGPLVISACISDRTGIGRAGRLTVKAAEAWGVPVIVHDIAGDPHMHRVPRDLPTGGVWIAHCNPPEAAVVMSQASEHLWATRYRIGYWAYELSELPRFWRSAIPFFTRSGPLVALSPMRSSGPGAPPPPSCAWCPTRSPSIRRRKQHPAPGDL